jgi:hypothetical protein
MAELLKTKEEDLATADLASYGITQKQPDGPTLVKSQDPKTLDRAAAVSDPMPLFSELDMGDFRRSGAGCRLVSWTSRAGRSKAQTSL